MSTPDQTPPLPGDNPPDLTPSTSLVSRMLNIFAAPGEVFEEVKASAASAGNWLAPALVLILLSWIGSAIIFSQGSIQAQMREAMDKQIQKQVDSGNKTQEEADQARAVGEKFGGIFQKIEAFVAPVFAAFIIPFWGGLIVWLVGTRILGGHFEYMKAVEVAGLANMIGVLDVVIKTLLVVTTGNFLASPSLALLLKEYDPQNMSHIMLSALNVMTFWALGVRAVGLAKLSGASFAKAALWVFGIWAVMSASFLSARFALQTAMAHLGAK